MNGAKNGATVSAPRAKRGRCAGSGPRRRVPTWTWGLRRSSAQLRIGVPASGFGRLQAATFSRGPSCGSEGRRPQQRGGNPGRIWIGLEPRGVAQGHTGRRQEQVRGLDSCGQGSAAGPNWGVEWGKSGGLGFCWRCGCWLNDQSLPPPTQHLFSQSGSPHHPSPTPSGPPSQLNPRTPRNHLSPEQT